MNTSRSLRHPAQHGRHQHRARAPATRPWPSSPRSLPSDTNNFGPRIGFAWDVYGTGRTTLRGGYGMYFGRIINSNVLTTYLASGNKNGQLTFSGITPYTCMVLGAQGPDLPQRPAAQPAFP